MKSIKNKSLTGLMAGFLVVLSLFPTLSNAATINERPSGLSMMADAVVVRPLMLVSTAIGAGVYVATLPFSLMGGNATEVGEQMVIVPFKSTFLRCLGCTKRHLRDRDQYY